MGNWSYKQPSVSGYYWCWLDGLDEPCIANVDVARDELHISFTGNETPFTISNDEYWEEDFKLFKSAMWCGPIPPPEL